MAKTKKNEKKSAKSRRSGTRKNAGKTPLSYGAWKKRAGVVPSLNIDIAKFLKSYAAVRKGLSSLPKKDFEHISHQVLESLHKQAKTKNVAELFQLYSLLVQYKVTSDHVQKLKKCGQKFKYVDSQRMDGKCLGKLELGDEIGSGAFGSTYLVKDGKRTRALKIQEAKIRGFDEKLLPLKEICDKMRQLKNEVTNLTIAGTMGISPKVYNDYMCIDHLQSKVSLYIVMDHIEGDKLSVWLEKNSLTKKDKTTLKSMLEKLHRKNILHQDLHGENIIVTKNRRFYIIDYGMSSGQKDTFQREMDGFIKSMGNKNFVPWGPKTEMSDLDKLAIQIMIDVN